MALLSRNHGRPIVWQSSIVPSLLFPALRPSEARSDIKAAAAVRADPFKARFKKSLREFIDFVFLDRI
jgi:hypothetical protein